MCKCVVCDDEVLMPIQDLSDPRYMHNDVCYRCRHTIHCPSCGAFAITYAGLRLTDNDWVWRCQHCGFWTADKLVLFLQITQGKYGRLSAQS
jgi:hypothetical protein